MALLQFGLIERRLVRGFLAVETFTHPEPLSGHSYMFAIRAFALFLDCTDSEQL